MSVFVCRDCGAKIPKEIVEANILSRDVLIDGELKEQDYFHHCCTGPDPIVGYGVIVCNRPIKNKKISEIKVEDLVDSY